MRRQSKLVILLLLTTVILSSRVYLKELLSVISETSQSKQMPYATSLRKAPPRVFPMLEQVHRNLTPGAVFQQTCSSICKQLPSNLTLQEMRLKFVGNLTISKEDLAHRDLQSLSQKFQPHVRGGSWMYRDPSLNATSRCNVNSSSAVSIIIPLRNRWYQIPPLLSTLVPLLRKQKICYRVFIIEQADGGLFNKGKLFNSGFIEASKLFRFGCVVLQDTDLVPINDLIPYGCDEETSKHVIHLGVGLDDRNYQLRYAKLIGGVLKMTTEQFVSVNGFSNEYWGWGQEDDDMEKRLRQRNIDYVHISPAIARYASMPHEQQERVRRSEHLRLLKTAHLRMQTDGLNSVKYKLIHLEESTLFTLILVDVRDNV
ncbi:beta-1 4-galactosyltransferase 4 [Clonorchis sinensis]|uniref:Beta-1,4-galactosyltransferase n=1 Tax=Clonorchis sinensis TaxID=79923 RepID=H2KTY1_CLOSI|nr:beta-1 4-galactosyltransferase 4 [Clonorchis sinensis]